MEDPLVSVLITCYNRENYIVSFLLRKFINLLACDLTSHLRAMGAEVLAPSRQELDVVELSTLRSAIQDSRCDRFGLAVPFHGQPLVDALACLSGI